MMAWNSKDSPRGPYGPTIGGCTHAEAVAAWVSEKSNQMDVKGKASRRCQRIAVDASDDFATLSQEACNSGVFN